MPQTSDTAIRTVAPSLRFIPSLRDLRLAGLGVVAIAALLAIPSWGDIALLLPTITPHLLTLAAIPVFWLLAVWLGFRRITPTVIVTVGSIAAVGFHCRRWWVIYEQSSIRLGLLLVMALVSLGLGLFAASDLLLRGIRDGMDPRPEASDDPARFRPLLRTPVSPDTRVRRLTRVLPPVLALVLAVLLVHVFTNPVSQVAASPPPGSLPARPTRISTTPTWEKEVPGLLEVAAGAAGPMLFTDEGLTALNPTDGSVLWSYRRDRASYVSLPFLGNEIPQGSLATTSPTGRHVAFRIRSAKDLTDKHRDSQDRTDKTLVYDAVTIVIDTLTGQVTGEHPSNTTWRIQLSDSALLDGDTAYNLTDGQQRWTMKGPHRSTHNPAGESTDYSGPAGHNPFILSYTENELYSDKALDGVLKIAPDTDPTKVSEVVSIAVGGRHSTPVVAGGWVAHFTEPIDVHNSEPNEYGKTHEIITNGIETEAVTLDSLAGLEPKSPVALGKTTGINSYASRATGTLAAYPDYSPDPLPIWELHDRYNKPKVGAVFDPVTRTTTQASHYPGLAAATVGIAVITGDGSRNGAIIVQPSDGSQAAMMPIAPGTTAEPPDSLGARSPEALPQLAAPHKGETASTIFMTAPGLTLVAFDPESGVGYESHNDNTDTSYVHQHVHHLYGLTGES
ncbi:hypothetical protein V7R84_07505 [Arachnia propionica]|uniref:hypothetical protein n=1 Tax=Arachnia propionica TaxID=1750 RepID=UPI0030CC82E5